MDEVGIVSVKVGKDNNMKVKAEERIPFVFTFTRPLKEGEIVEVECHLYEKKRNLNETYDEIFALTMKPQTVCSWTPDIELSCDSEPIHITIREELAGATVNVNFVKKSKPPFFPPVDPFYGFKTVALEILSSEGGPKIEAIHWSDTKKIEYGKLSAARTGALLKNETVFLHIHTRGMYGKQVVCRCTNIPAALPRTLTMENNVLVVDYTFFDTNINKIELQCSPFPVSALLADAVSKSVTIPYIKDEEVTLSTKVFQVFAFPNVPRKKHFASEAKCRVDFRPMNDYDGSFGFSWYRMGDMRFDTMYLELPTLDISEHPTVDFYRRTNQRFYINLPCNDHPFGESDFPDSGDGILGKHYEMLGLGAKAVQDKNNSGSGSATNPLTGRNLYQSSIGARDNFYADTTMVADHKNDYPKINLFGYTDAEQERLAKEYLAPVMTLECGKTASLRLFLHVKETPKEILFVFDNPVVEIEDFVTINVKINETASPAPETAAPTTDIPAPATNIVSPATTTWPFPNIEYFIEITCNKQFDKELRLKAYAIPGNAEDGTVKKERGRLVLYPKEGLPLVLPELCGMLRILPNDDDHWRKIDVVFFDVKTNLDKTKTPKIGLTPPPSIEIGHPRVEPQPPSSYLVPVPPPPPFEKQCKTIEESYLNHYLAQAYVIARVVVEEIDLTNSTAYENICIDSNNDGILDTYDYENDGNGKKIKKILKNHPLSVEYDAKNYYRLYFMPDRATRVGGFSAEGENFTICFAVTRSSVPVHELGHTLGLPHTFNGNQSHGAKYTYEDGKTDNIMDYSHLIGVRIQSFFHWQWEVLNTKLK